MAEALLYGLATDILKSLTTEMDKPGGSFDAKGELQSLKGTVKTIQAVLLDAEKQQWHNNPVKLWLKRLKDVLYDIQDLLDDVATQDLRRKVTSGNKMLKEVRGLFSKSNQLAYHLKVANKIQELRKKLDQIAKDTNNFHLEQYLSDAAVATVRKRETIPLVHKEEIIGREEDKTAIIAYLLDSSPDESVSVVSIVGIGGLGKTALAQLVYNDDEVKDWFKLKIWVCVSDIFDEDSIIREILKSAQYEHQGDPEMRKLQDIENESKDQLQRLLLEVLGGKKYLLVLDDLWNEDRERWWELRRLLMSGSWGSKILITTRYRSVVQAIDAKSVVHAAQGLSEDDSWELFKKMAFGNGEKPFNSRLEETGRGIVQRCGRVPLAIKTIGSLLYDKGESEWLSFKEHELSKISSWEDRDIMEVLKLSYDHLPWWLKNCFAYCALFPKNYVFDKQTMIQLWMAQGFIESLNGNEDLEETGDSYVTDLLFRSFLEVEKVDHSTGKVKMFKMHDLMHDLALKVAGDESKMINLNEDDTVRGIRHASFDSQSSSLRVVASLLEANLQTILSLEKSRTFLQNLSPNEYQAIFSKFRHCRVLGLGYADFSIPPSFGSLLKHLRFLDVSGNRSIESLPDSITDLLNLQTLKLSRCKNLKTLPRDLKKLVNLRHLLIDGCDSLSHMPCGLSNLSSLQTLSQYISQKMDHKVPGGVGRVDELSGLNRLAGSITLGKLEFLQPTSNKGYLREKQYLHSLELKWSWEQAEHQYDKSESHESIMWENLKPHQNLAHLTIFGCVGKNPPSWLSSIANLVDLVLWACRGWKYLPPLSALPSLRKLDLVGLEELEFVQSITEFPFFPSLERLFLLHCGSLKGWLGNTQQVGSDQDHWLYDSKSSFPKLLSVEIWGCPHLNSMPLFPWIENLNIDGVSPKLLEQQVMAVSNYPSKVAVVSTSNPLSTLKDLYFGGVIDLEHPMLETLLPFLGNLKSMSLQRCIELRSLSHGMQCLSSLQYLDIWACKELDLSSHDDEHGTQWRSLAKLRGLRIGLLQKLVVLPEGIRHVTTLQSLEVEFCDNLKSLPEWIDNFSSLQELEIIGCPSLTHLPNGMRRLTSLKKLSIFGCPTLAKRCQTDGEDWAKIAQVPSLSIEGVKTNQNQFQNLIKPSRIRNFGCSLIGFPFSLGSK